MHEYDVVIAKLASRARTDEESITDLLNERARAGWEFHSLATLSPGRVVVVFRRDTA